MLYECNCSTTGGQLVINILKMNDSNYPETLYKSYIVNSMYAFSYNMLILCPIVSSTYLLCSSAVFSK